MAYASYARTLFLGHRIRQTLWVLNLLGHNGQTEASERRVREKSLNIPAFDMMGSAICLDAIIWIDHLRAKHPFAVGTTIHSL